MFFIPRTQKWGHVTVPVVSVASKAARNVGNTPSRCRKHHLLTCRGLRCIRTTKGHFLHSNTSLPMRRYFSLALLLVLSTVLFSSFSWFSPVHVSVYGYLSSWVAAPQQTQSTIRYVDLSATGANNGTSWANAYTDLQAAIDACAASGDQIWVAQGTYYPTTGTNRSASFYIEDKDIEIYGGFMPGDANLNDRSTDASLTVLSGDIGTVGVNADNSYHVVHTVRVSAAFIMDGFVISGGKAEGNFPQNFGGGWYNDGRGSGNSSNPTLINCMLSNNHAVSGGAMYNDAFMGTSNPTLTNCTLSGNTATENGGAMYNKGLAGISNPILINCTLSGNTATLDGGAMYNGGYAGTSNPTLINCILSSNTANDDGGAMYNRGDSSNGNSSPTLINCTLFGNAANDYGGAMYNSGYSGISDPTFTNCIVFGNSSGFGQYSGLFNDYSFPTYTNSLIQGVSASGNNLDGSTDPLLADPANGDYTLQPCSPVIDAGLNSANTTTTDLAGNARITNSQIDLGAYESTVLTGPKVYYVHSATAAPAAQQDGLTWGTAFAELQPAIDVASVCGGDQIWVAQGTYYPTTGTDRNASFYIQDKDIEIYGGFTPGDTDLTDRSTDASLTILSGDIGAVGDDADNSYSVVHTVHVSAAFVMDGFTITGGNANVNTIPNFHGGGWYNDGSGTGNASNPQLRNCTLSGNTAGLGGAMYNNGHDGSSNPTLTNCTLSDNRANVGGAIYSTGGSGTLNATYTNCLFEANTAIVQGGVIYYDDGNTGNPNFINCTLTGNASPSGDVVYNLLNDGANPPVFTNCILWNNGSGDLHAGSGDITVTYSVVEEAVYVTGTDNNTSTDPLFASPSNGEYTLSLCSPVIDAGLNSANTTGTDLAGNARIIDSQIDLGAYETTVITGPKVYYVHSATAAPAVQQDGLTWGTAFAELQPAIDAANNNCGMVGQIWVAQGTYYPTGAQSGTNRNASFYIEDKDIEIYGGFTPGDANLTDRSTDANLTVLSGDIGTAGDDTDNSYHVVHTVRVSAAFVMEGFTISGGKAEGNFPQNSGGGWFNNGWGVGNASQPTLRNCTLANNEAEFGGGMYNYGYQGNSSPTLTDCTLSDNTATDDGGALHNYGFDGNSSPTLTNCILSGNTSADRGGAIYENGEFGTLDGTYTNCLFTANEGTFGSVYGYDDSDIESADFINCTFAGNISNTPYVDVVVYTEYWDSGLIPLQFTNCIFWDNGIMHIGPEGSAIAVTHSIVQEAQYATGTGNIHSAPLFADPTVSDYRLLSCSPGINAGLTTANTTATDLDDNARVQLTGIDLGAYESTAVGQLMVYYVDSAKAGISGYVGDGLSWETAFAELGSALAVATSDCGLADTIHVAQGTYYPTTDNNRDTSFYIADKGFIMLGGYPTGGGTRDWTANPTILSGDIGLAGDSTDNVYHVVHTVRVSEKFIMDGFTISGGNADGSTNKNRFGGGWYNDGTDNSTASAPTIANCLIKGNYAHTGGGLHNHGLQGNATATLNNTTITDNKAFYGGGIYNSGHHGNSGVTLTDCVISNNTAYQGGGIHNYAVYGTVASTLTDCTIRDNVSDDNGGGMHNTNYDGTSRHTLTGCIISNNTSGLFGGGMVNSAAVSGVYDLQMTDCTLDSNVAVAGGALYNNVSSGGEFNITLTNGSFAANTATEGGAVYNSLYYAKATTDYSDCTWTGNSADKGGAFYNTINTCAVTSTAVDCIWSANTATEEGGVLYQTGYNDTLRSTYTNCVLAQNTADLKGGVISVDDLRAGNRDFVNCTFADNSSPAGGVVHLSDWPYTQSPTSFTNCVFGNNGTMHAGAGSIAVSYSIVEEAGYLSDTANVQADPLFDTSNGTYSLQTTSPAINSGLPGINSTLTDIAGNPRLLNCQIDMGAYEVYAPADPASWYVDAAAAPGGDGTSWQTAFTKVTDALEKISCEIVDTIHVATGIYYPTDDGDRGASFYVADRDIIMLGGYPAGGGQRDWTANPTILSGNIGDTNDDTDNSFHVVHTEGLSSAFVMDGFTISDGYANAFDLPPGTTQITVTNIDVHGAGWYNGRHGTGNVSNPTIRNCTIENNFSTGIGGGMFNSGAHGAEASPTYINCIIRNNVANSCGGGLANYGELGISSPTLTDCVISGNSTLVSGGGLYNYSTYGIGEVTLENCIIEGNTALDGGGTTHFSWGGTANARLTNCTIKDNIATGKGGGMVHSASFGVETVSTLTNCNVVGNYSMDQGGGVYYYGRVEATNTNCLFAQNTADNDGGVMFSYDIADTEFNSINCTYADNSSPNGGVLSVGGYIDPDHIFDFKNCIFYSNGTMFDGLGSTNALVEYSVVEEALYLSGTGNAMADPLFTDAVNDDYTLQPGSPAIDAGLSASNMTLTDLAGSDRILGSAIDMGAYERAMAIATGTGCNPMSATLVDGTGTTGDFVLIADAQGDVVAAIENTQNLGLVSVQYYGHSGGMRQHNGAYYADRNLTIVPETQPSTPIAVRFFFTDAEIQQLINGSLLIHSISDIALSKVSSTSCSASMPSSGTLLFQTDNGAIADGWYIEVQVPQFSEFFAVADASPLPVELLDLTARAEGDHNVVQWLTETEESLSHYEVEYSENGATDWRSIGTVEAEQSGAYRLTHTMPTTVSYYRLRMVDLDGTQTLSGIVVVEREEDFLKLHHVWPVPTTDQLHVRFVSDSDREVTVTLLDLTGRVVLQTIYSAQASLNDLTLELQHLPAGTYHLQLRGDSLQLSEKVVKR